MRFGLSILGIGVPRIKVGSHDSWFTTKLYKQRQVQRDETFL